MNKKFLLSLMFVMLLSISIVSAVPPQASQAVLGYELRVPQVETLKLNEGVISHIHVFNVSNGVPITPANSNVGCALHLYSSNGTQLLTKAMDVDSNNLEWELIIDGGNFSQLGHMAVTIFCNDTNAGGFVSEGLHVTENGNAIAGDNIVIFFSILIIAIVVLLLTSLLYLIYNIINWSLDGQDMTIAVSIYFGLFMTYFLAIGYLGNKFIEDLLLLFIEVGAITHVIIPIVGFFMYFFRSNLEANRSNPNAS